MCVKYVCQQCVGFPSFALPPLSLSLSFYPPLLHSPVAVNVMNSKANANTMCRIIIIAIISVVVVANALQVRGRYESGKQMTDGCKYASVCVCVRLVLCSCARANWMACWSLSVTCPNQPDELHTRDWAKQIAFWMSLFFSVCFVIFHITHTFGFHLPERV